MVEKNMIPVDYDNTKRWDKNPDSAKRRMLKYNRHGESKRILSFKGYSALEKGIWGAKPKLNLITEIDTRPKAQYLVGIEIEVENYSDTKHSRMSDLLVKHLPDSHYVCTDGSLDRGVEIVTAPRTSSEIRLMYSHYYKLLNGLSKIGMTAHDNGKCGLHFHISRKLYPNDTWQAMSKFIVHHQKMFKKLSRRGNSLGYCKFEYSTNDRYVALNLTNEHTVEFRLFRGTLKPESFFAAFEIVISLLELFRTGQKQTLRKWAKVLQGPNYKYAYRYCLDRGLAPYTKPPTPRVKLTEEQRAARALRLANKRQAQFETCIDYLRKTITWSRISDQAVHKPSNIYNIDLSKREVVTSMVPVWFSTDFGQKYHRALEKASFCVPMKHIKGTRPIRVVISKRHGWGNTHYWHEVQWPRNACYFGTDQSEDMQYTIGRMEEMYRAIYRNENPWR